MASGRSGRLSPSAYNLARDEASCVVFGMPKEAIVTGSFDEVAPLQEMTPKVMKYLARLDPGFRSIG